MDLLLSRLLRIPLLLVDYHLLMLLLLLLQTDAVMLRVLVDNLYLGVHAQNVVNKVPVDVRHGAAHSAVLQDAGL